MWDTNQEVILTVRWCNTMVRMSVRPGWTNEAAILIFLLTFVLFHDFVVAKPLYNCSMVSAIVQDVCSTRDI